MSNEAQGLKKALAAARSKNRELQQRIQMLTTIVENSNMFPLLIDWLSEEQQSEILAQAVQRQGKGLTAPDPFLELSIDTIIYAVIGKVMEYKNSYAEARLSKLGLINMPVSIWCDRATELVIFLRGIARNVNEFEAALLRLYPLISREELLVQTGGLKLGYWHLFAAAEQEKGINEDTLRQIADYLKGFLREEQSSDIKNFSFSDELDGYINAKKKHHKICAISGRPVASAMSASGSPYKVQAYSNRRRLGVSGDGLTTQLSPEWQKELTLRFISFGKDDRHQKMWVYSDMPIDEGNLPMTLDYPIHAIKRACLLAANGGKSLISPSVVPYKIGNQYRIECFPDWLSHFGCKDTGDRQDAARILEVIKVFEKLHSVKPLSRSYEKSISLHGQKAMSEAWYLPHVLPKEHETDIRYIHKALKVLDIQ
jgi:hypothetical protein